MKEAEGQQSEEGLWKYPTKVNASGWGKWDRSV